MTRNSLFEDSFQEFLSHYFLQKNYAEITEIGSLEDHDTRLVSFENLEVFRKGLRELIQKGENDFSVRSAITKILVHKIEILNDGFEIHFHVGQAHYNQALGDQTPDASFFVSFARCDSSRRLTNGGSGENRTRT
ncbi:MAG: hypothetical protein ACK5WZ_13290 [Pseudobdellovibrionaceae bacterium]